MNISFSFFPLIPWVYLNAVVGSIVLLLVMGFIFKKRFLSVPRVIALLVLLLVFINPQGMQEIREALPQKLVIVVDESPSQKIDGRAERSEKALGLIHERLESMPQIEAVTIRTDGMPPIGKRKGDGTMLFPALEKALSGFSDEEVAGTVLITDGQVSDMQKTAADLKKAGPVNVILTGRKSEKDHRIEILSVPKFGLIDGTATIRVKAISAGDGPLVVSISRIGEEPQQLTFQDGEEKDIPVTLTQAGQNAVSFTIPDAGDEISLANNRAVAVITAIRDRLRVLLVSGAPHMGERAWRNILKSDPAIDLVHFTILRAPQSMDATPPSEMALIPFPVDEIFRNKIKSFDLIILDRYRQYDLLPDMYFQGIKNYVEEGGALFWAAGTDIADEQIFMTPLADILPVSQRNKEGILTGDILPAVSAKGKKHPVTASLTSEWAPWHGQMAFSAASEDTLLTGAGNLPLLTIKEAGKGRVAVLASDNIWLWSKSTPEGQSRGPYMPLIGNVIDWLTREPDMNPGYLKADPVAGGKIRVSLRPAENQDTTVSVNYPDGAENNLVLSDALSKGWHVADIDAGMQGLYSFHKGQQVAYAAAGGDIQSEYINLSSTPDILAPLVQDTGGNVIWGGESPDFDIGYAKSDNAIRMLSKDPYKVISSASMRLIPDGLGITAILFALMGCWWYEGRKR